ncbi:MAG: molybdopterin molybdotransferase MoeA [Ardenticatenales bacterium]|nr:molybdopterin molybdotransferase MoeA [Ardenticatenales bacterium]
MKGRTNRVSSLAKGPLRWSFSLSLSCVTLHNLRGLVIIGRRRPELLISVQHARTSILEYFSLLPPEHVTLWEAATRVLAQEVVAGHDVPPFRNSAMDGYAVRGADVTAASRSAPVRLRVVAQVAAGALAEREVGPGEAVRIMTGAPMPDGADAVVRFEDTSELWPVGERPATPIVAICQAVPPWENVRAAGEDLREGEAVLPSGTLLRPAHLGVLASLGWGRLPVVRRPRVAILATGDELVNADAPLEAGKIRNSNETTMAALVAQAGGEPLPLGIARDNVESLSAKLREGLAAGVDLFLTSAGVSVGDYDIVKEVLAAEGEMTFWQVAIKPGKPLAFGLLNHESRRVPLLGLPGNPVAAMVAFHVFAQPAIRLMGGRVPLFPPVYQARLLDSIENSGRRHYMRARYSRAEDGTLEVATRGSGVRVQGSGILSSMVWANCFVVVPETVNSLPVGATVEIEPFVWVEEDV